MNQLTTINPQTNVEAYRASTEAASLCKEIVLQTAMEIQKRKYVKVEGWQAIAIAHGCTASARDVERVEGGVRAIGEIRRMYDGAIIATAEGFVGEDEPTWYGGTKKSWKWGEKRGEKVWYDEEMPKRADYAIRAMAQTRAISRACRSAFAHVVVMMNAGLETTPAEEVPMGGFDNGDMIEATPVKSQDAPFPQGPAKNKTELKALARQFWREVEGCGDPDELESLIKDKGNVQLVTQLIKAMPKWWEGSAEGEEPFEGLEEVIRRRQSDLAVAALNAG